MKNLKANNERRADGVYFVRSASDQTARDEHLLYLLVSDGKILRTAMQFSPTFDAESVRERFFQIAEKSTLRKSLRLMIWTMTSIFPS